MQENDSSKTENCQIAREKWFLDPVGNEVAFFPGIESWDFSNLTPSQQKHVKYNSKIFRSDYVSKPSKVPACINAISGRTFKINGLQDVYDGETLNIYPGYTEFRPTEPEMNIKADNFEKFKTWEEKTKSEINKTHALHFNYKKNQYDFACDHENFKVAREKGVDKILEIEPSPKLTKLQIAQKSAQEAIESRLFIQGQGSQFSEKSKRGIISCISAKSANRLKKKMSRVLGLDLWIDLTFSDDVFKGMNFQEKLTYSYSCLNEFERLLRSKNLHYVWKKEIMARRSGVLEGERVPHYHVAVCCLSEEQKRRWQQLSIILLIQWVKITGTKNPKAWKVALNKDKQGKPSSYRLINNAKMAGAYIGKYFGKTEDLENFVKESIGRAWGNSKGIPLASAIVVNLTREESIIIRRIMRKAYKLKKNKRFIGVLEQLKRGYATFLFCSGDLVERLLIEYVLDPFKAADPIPF